MDLELENKVAVVTGGSRGIGLATARLLLAEGMHVLAGSRRSTPELEAIGAAHLAVDLTTAEGPARLVDEAIKRFGGLDLLVNNVGVGDTDEVIRGATQDLGTLTDDAWQHTFDLHFYSALRAIRAKVSSSTSRLPAPGSSLRAPQTATWPRRPLTPSPRSSPSSSGLREYGR